MPTLHEWLQKAMNEAPPKMTRALFEGFPDLLESEVAIPASAAYPWNTRWLNGIGTVKWLNQFFNSGGEIDELALAWIESRALLPAPEELVIMELTRQFKASAAWLFVVHGNVRDYFFDGQLGFAPLPNVLESYWVDSCLFSSQGDRPEALAIRYALSTGFEIGHLTPGGSQTESIKKRFQDHARSTERCSLEERVLQDFCFLNQLLEDPATPPTLVFFERPALLFPTGQEHARAAHWLEHILHWAAKVPRKPYHLMVLAVESLDELHTELRKPVNGILHLTAPRPGKPGDRSRFLLACMAACNSRPLTMERTRLRSRTDYLPWTVSEVTAFADATAGLNYRGIETCLLNILENNLKTSSEALHFLQKQRGDLLRTESEGLLELVEPKSRLDEVVGGLDIIRQRLEFVIASMASDDPGTRRLMPMGALFVGPPGTGKSLTAEALASECEGKVHFVKMGDFRDMWVGQSERNFSRILGLLETFGKVIVFMDELDQTEGGTRSGGAHETSRRIFGKLLQFMADESHRGRIFWIAATNRPDQVDPALLRPGRFDLILPFEPPPADGCREILKLHLKKSNFPVQFSEFDLQSLAVQMSNRELTGAEIQLVVTEAARRTVPDSSQILGIEALQAVLDDYQGNPKNTADYQAMVESCRRFVPFKSLQKK